MATRAAQKAQGLTPAQALAFVERRGIVCEAAHRGTIPSLVDEIAGEKVRGNWWSHARRREIFAATRAVRDAPQVLVCRIVDGKVTFVHERLWPALARLADRFPRERLARVREIHSASGRHVIEQTAFPDWLTASALAAAKRLGQAEALAQLSALTDATESN